MAIRILITGGTFDKEYDEITGNLYFKETHMPELLMLGRSQLECKVSTLMMKDSLQMNLADREAIAQCCIKASEDKILITHGTDTMVETAVIIAAKKIDKTIVLTGAMIPYAFGSSDGLFNIGSALSFVQTLSSGVYIAINGQYFGWDNVKKNRELGRFERIKS